MKETKKKKLQAAGWKVGSAAEFLELSAAEEMLVNMKVSLAKNVKAMRQQNKITQQQLAKLIGSSQSRVAKLETADRSVSLELLIRALSSMGATRAQIGIIVGAKNVKKAAAKKKALAKR